LVAISFAYPSYMVQKKWDDRTKWVGQFLTIC